MNNELLATILEALAKYKEDIDDINSSIELLTDETKANQDEVIKVRDFLTKQIEDIYIQTDKLINKAIASLEIPEADKVDYQRIETSIKAKINRLMDSKDKDISELRADLKDFVIANLSRFKPKDGKDGLDGKDGANGKDGVGIKGKDGDDGIGIKDITRDKDELVIELTSGDIKRFKLPKTTILKGGGGGLNLSGLSELTELLETDEMLVIRNEQHTKSR